MARREGTGMQYIFINVKKGNNETTALGLRRS